MLHESIKTKKTPRNLSKYAHQMGSLTIISPMFDKQFHKSIRIKSSEADGKVGYPWESTQAIYQHIPPIYGLYNGFRGAPYGVSCFGNYCDQVPSQWVNKNFPLSVAEAHPWLCDIYPSEASESLVIGA